MYAPKNLQILRQNFLFTDFGENWRWCRLITTVSSIYQVREIKKFLDGRTRRFHSEKQLTGKSRRLDERAFLLFLLMNSVLFLNTTQQFVELLNNLRLLLRWILDNYMVSELEFD